MRNAGSWAVVVVVAVAGCLPSSAVGPFVKSLRLTDDGTALVVERCTIEYSNSFGGSVSQGECHSSRVSLPPASEELVSPAVDTETAPAVAPLTRREVAVGIANVRPKIDRCGTEHGVGGRVVVRFAIASSGAVESVAVDRGSDAFKVCVATAFAPVRYRRSGRRLEVEQAFVFPDPGGPPSP